RPGAADVSSAILIKRSENCQQAVRRISLSRMATAQETTTADRSTRRSADATRARILEAAIELFSELSFDGATTREIAARAGVTQPLLNYHYRSKDELWQAAVDSLFDRLAAVMAARTEGLRGVDEVTSAKLLIREFVTFS